MSKWEQGESLPGIEVLYKLSRLYGVSLDYLAVFAAMLMKRGAVHSGLALTAVIVGGAGGLAGGDRGVHSLRYFCGHKTVDGLLLGGSRLLCRDGGF